MSVPSPSLPPSQTFHCSQVLTWLFVFIRQLLQVSFSQVIHLEGWKPMNLRGSYRALRDNSKAAMFAAIEIYNKPQFAGQVRKFL
jgi:hypothetical protein